MKFFLISENMDTLTGLRLGGINGVLAREKEEILLSIKNAMADKSIGIILITEKAFNLVKEEEHNLYFDKNSPMMITIPDRNGSSKGEDYLTNYIREAIGIKL